MTLVMRDSRDTDYALVLAAASLPKARTELSPANVDNPVVNDLAHTLQPLIAGRRRAICCHSGTLSGRFPPNSLANVAECVEASAPRVEVDVRFMADDALLIFHDARLDPSTSGSGKVANLTRADLADVSYRWGSPHGLCFLEDVVDLVRGSATMLQVDLKLMRPITDRRAEALQAALKPLSGNVIVGSQAHWNLRSLVRVPIAFDPTLQWHYDPERTFAEALPRTLGIHGLWDDAPIAVIRHATPETYAESRIRDIRALLPAAVEWMVDFATIFRLAEFGVALGDRLREVGCALAAWTVREDTPSRRDVVQRLYALGTETIITDAPLLVAEDAAAAL